MSVQNVYNNEEVHVSDEDSKMLYLFSWDYFRSLGLSEAIVFYILGVFLFW